MISITIHPQSAAHIDVMAQALKALLSTVTPPAVAPTQAEVAKAIEHAVEAQKETPPPKPARAKKAEAPAATPPAPSASDTPQPELGATAETATESPSEPVPVLTLEQVRAKLAPLSQSGKREAIKAAIASFGVDNLTSVPVDKYPELLAKVGV